METLAVNSRPLPIRRPNQSEDPGTGALFADLVSALMAPKASPPPAKTGNERAPRCCEAVPRSEADTRPPRTDEGHRAADTDSDGPAATEPPNGDQSPRANSSPTDVTDQRGRTAPNGASTDQAASGEPGQIIAQSGATQSSATSAVLPTLGIVPPIPAWAVANGLRTASGPAMGQDRFEGKPEAIGSVSAVTMLAAITGADAAPAGNAIASDAAMAASGIVPTDASIDPVPPTVQTDQQIAATPARADLPAAAPSRPSADGTAAPKPALASASDVLAAAQAALTEDPAAVQATGSSPGNGAPETPSSVRETGLATRAAPQGDADLPSASPDGTAMTARTLEPAPVASSQAPAVAQGTGTVGSLRQADHAPRAIATIDQVAVHIRHAAAAGLDKIRIQLWPEDLGRVDIQLEVHESGSVKATILSDRPETLDLLQRDSRSLDRALQDAGLKTDSNSLHFASHDRSDRGQHRDPQSSGSQHAQALADGPLGEADDDPAPLVLRLNRNSLLDIQV